jgi:DNA-binding NarL/FixJ family response regulator
MLHTKKLQIEQVNNEIEIEQYKKEKAIKEFRKSDIYKKFHQAESLIELTEEDWDVLQTEIDNTYIDFTNHLYALFPLSNIELKICLLLKCGIPVSKIASLIGRSKSAVTSARKKLYEKINNKKGTPDMFDKIIDKL